MEGLQIIEITAAYSNAVLLAILPNVSDFARKLDLPIPQPVIAAHVQSVEPYPYKGYPAQAALTLTNGYKFWHSHRGYVNSFRSRDNYFFLPPEWEPEDYSRVTNYWGRMNMTTNEVIEFARDSLRKLAYDLKAMNVDRPPTEFEGPFLYRNRPIPHCRVEWRTPKSDERLGKQVIDVYVNAEAGQLIGLSVNSTNAWRTPPAISVEPEVVTNSQKRMPSPILSRTNAPARRPIPTRPDR